MAQNQEIDNEKSNSIKNNYEGNSDKIEAGVGGNLGVDDNEEVEIIEEADQFPQLDDQKDSSVDVDLTESLKEWPVRKWRGRSSNLTNDSVDPVKLARQLLRSMKNVDESEPANRISKAKTLGTNRFYESGDGKTDEHLAESRSDGVVCGESVSKLASESDSESNFDGVTIKKKNKMENIKPCDSDVVWNGSPVTPKHPKPIPDSGTEPQPKKYRCSICGKSFATFQGMGGHKRHHKIEDWFLNG